MKTSVELKHRGLHGLRALGTLSPPPAPHAFSPTSTPQTAPLLHCTCARLLFVFVSDAKLYTRLHTMQSPRGILR